METPSVESRQSSTSRDFEDSLFNKKLNIIVSSLAHYGRAQSLVALCAELIRHGHSVTFGASSNFVDNIRELLIGDDASQIKIVPIPVKVDAEKRKAMLRTVSRRDNSNTLGVMKVLMSEFIEHDSNEAPYYLELLLDNKYDVALADVNAGGLFMAVKMAKSLHNQTIPTIINHPILAQGELTMMKHQPGYYPASNEVILYDTSFRTRLYNVVKRRVVGWVASSLLNGLLESIATPKLGLHVAPLSFPVLVGTAMGFEVPHDAPPHFVYTGPMIDHSVLTPEMAEKDAIIQWTRRDCSDGVILVSLGTSVAIDRDEWNPLGRAVVDMAQNDASNLCFLWSLKDVDREMLDGDITQDIASLNGRFRIEPFVPMRLLLKFSPVKGMVSQGGVASVSESLYFGVPLVVLPFLFDQIDLAVRVEAVNAGISIGPQRPHNATRVKEAVLEIVKDPSYARQAQVMGDLFRSAGGIRRGAQMVESVAHLGVEHWLPQPYRGEKTPWYVHADTDVVAFLTTVGWILLTVLVTILKKMARRISRWSLAPKLKTE